MQSLLTWLQNSVHGLTETGRQIVLWAVGVGLVTKDFAGREWTETQTVLTLSAVSAILSLIASKSTVAANKVEERKQEAFEKGVAAGVAQAASGTGGTGRG